VENIAILLGNGVETLKIFKLNFHKNYNNLSTADDNTSIVEADLY